MSTEVSGFDYMNIKETAERMGIDRRTLAESIKSGTPFPHHHFMSLIAIPIPIFGILLTIFVQSSSVSTSTIVPLAGAGVLTLRQIYPFTLGANLGTTVTALLASLTLNVTAMVAAFSHLFFNIFGIIIIYLNPFLREIPIRLAERMADIALKNKLLPIVYLIIVFFGIPLTIIFLGG